MKKRRAPRPKRIETRHGPVWRYTYRDGAGHHRSITIGPSPGLTEKQACLQLWTELDKRARGPVPTLAEFIGETWLPPRWRAWESARTKATVMTALRNLITNRPIAGMPLDAIERCHIDDWLGTMQKEGRALGSVRQAAQILRSTFEDAIDCGRILRNPARNVRMPALRKRKKTAAFTIDEFTRLVRIPGDTGLLFRVLLYGGLRPGELEALDCADVNVEAAQITVRRTAGIRQGLSGPTKTREELPVALPPGVVAELREYRGTRTGWLFTNPSGRPWTNWTLNRWMKRFALGAGVDGFTPRRCRATCATLIQDVSDAQAQLRHASPDMTLMHYRREIPERLRDALAALEKACAPKPVAVEKRKRRAG